MTTTERFSTADVEPSERLAFWNRIASQTYAKHVVEPRSAAFGGSLLRRSYGDLCLTQVTTTPAVLRHEMADSPCESEHALLSIQDAGSCERWRDGTPSRLTEGSLALNMLSFTRTISFEEPIRFIILKVPAARLAARIGDLGTLEGLRVEAEDAAMLAGFLRTLLGCDEPATDPGWDTALGDVIFDLITLTYRRVASAARPHPATRAESGERWRRTVTDFVDRHVGDPELSPAMIAHRLGVTPRYVQMGFAGMATTASAYIVARRLELAARLLRNGDRTISEVVFRTGFRDLSYFYRCFRKRFGVSPKRYAAQRAG